jgi:hypothetical protein
MVDPMGPGNRDWEAVRCGPEAGDWPRRVHDALTAARDHTGADGDRGPDVADLSGGETDLELHGTKTGRLPASGGPMRDMRLERNRDYPADRDLCFERGQYIDRIRLTDSDQRALWKRLYGSPAVALNMDVLVMNFLGEKLAEARANERLAFGEIGPGPEVRALQRVIALLEEK